MDGYWMFKCDNDGHDYLIRVADRLRFDKLLAEDEQKFYHVFGGNMLGQHIGRYIFKDPQVLRGSE